jgi:hypothetical protein
MFHLPRFLSPNPTVSQIAELRDELIITRTQLVFLQSMLRPKREPRKDKQSVREAKDAMTERLKAERERATFRRMVPVLFAGMGKGRAA